MPGTAATRDAFESCSRPSSFDSPSKLPVSGNGPRPSARKSLFPPALPALLLQVALLLDRPDAATCTKHGFVANHDARAFIGPIGIPYGFLWGGVYNLTVFDFEIDILAKKTSKRKKRTKKKADGEKTDTNNDDNKEDEQDAIDGSNNDDSDEETNKLLDALEGGFLLRRFESESEFAQFEETILEDPTKCSFESFREKQTHEKENADRVLETKGVASSNEAAVTSAADTASGAPAKDGIFLSMQDRTRSWKPNKPSVSHTFAVEEEGLYFLIYQVCPILQKDDDDDVESNNSRQNALSLLKKVRSTFELDFAYINYDRLGYPSYLTAGEMPLPGMFLYFSISFALCLGVWVGNIRNIQSGKDSTMVGFGALRNGRDASSSGSTSGGTGQRSRGGGGGGGGGGRPVVHPIHHMMTVLLLLKTLSVFFESVRYHYIRVSGHAELWSVVYYFFAFLKGVFLFTVILLIGSGWSFVKPFLNDREKKVIFLVLLLQVIDNVAVVILTHETMGERRYDNWRAVLHLVDILCCCAVLVPIVWQVNALERNMESQAGSLEGGEVRETSRTLTKLKLFRSFYLLVVAFIYFTRIIVFLVATFLGYKHTWVRYFLTELGTLTFYAVVGFLFRPMAENPYLEVRTDDYDESEDGGGTVRNSERVLEMETVSSVSDK